MKPLYTQEEFNNSKTNDLLQLECYCCSQSFSTKKQNIVRSLRHNTNENNKSYTNHFCSNSCTNKYNGLLKNTKQKIKCTNCDIELEKTLKQIKDSKNHFCSRSCSATYNNKNKTSGTRRSKLEIYMEEQLTILYPNLSIEFNNKNAIGSELDFYIPSLNLAFELNGIFHYEPIFGINKFNQIQSNDISKSKACHDNKIDLCIIDTSGQSYFKPSTSQKYLDIIINIVNERIG